VRLPEADPLFAEPYALLDSQADWQETDPRGGELDATAERILELRGLGLTCRHVVTSFLWEQVAPLQRCSHPMWAFTGVRDSTRLRKVRLTAEELDRRANQFPEGTQGAL
jgi:hypothetical protein